MTFKYTGHLDIDREHVRLHNLLDRIEPVCNPRRSGVDCRDCPERQTRPCIHALAAFTGEVLAFLAAHVANEEQLMLLMPSIASCQLHVTEHKQAHAETLNRLSALLCRLDQENLDTTAAWLGRLAARKGEAAEADLDGLLAREIEDIISFEIDLDAEMVTMLDEHVFRSLPTAPPQPTLHSPPGPLRSVRRKTSGPASTP